MRPRLRTGFLSVLIFPQVLWLDSGWVGPKDPSRARHKESRVMKIDLSRSNVADQPSSNKLGAPLPFSQVLTLRCHSTLRNILLRLPSYQCRGFSRSFKRSGSNGELHCRMSVSFSKTKLFAYREPVSSLGFFESACIIKED